MYVTKGMIKSLLFHDSISSLLPYGTYDPQRGIFFSDTYDFGMIIFEISPQPYPNSSFIDSLASIMSLSWPKGSIMQTTLYADPNIEPFLDRYMAFRGEEISIYQNTHDTFLYQFSQQNCQFARDHRFEGVHPQLLPVPFRNFRSFITFRVPMTVHDLRSGRNGVDMLVKVKRSLVSSLRASNIPFTEVTVEDLIKFLFRVWNPDETLDMPEDCYDIFKPIREQFILSHTRISLFKHDYLKIGKFFTCSKSPKSYKDRIPLNMVNLLLGDLTENSRQINCPFFLTTWANLESRNESIVSKGGFILVQKSATATLNARHSQRQDEYRQALEYIDNRGEVFMEGGIMLTLMAPTLKKCREASETVDAVWRSAGFKPQNEMFLALPMFMASIPGGMLPDFDKLKRTRVAPSKTWAILSATQADSKGTSTPTYMFFTRRGQIAFLDFRDSDSNYNGFISAPSGSGKSFLMNSFITQTLSTGGRAFIIDIGRSYQKLAELIDGQIVEFLPDSDLNLNLFDLITRERISDDDQDSLQSTEIETNSLRSMLHRLLCQMASPTTKISDNDSAVLQNALDDIIDKLKPGESLSIDKILSYLQSKYTELVRESRDTSYYFLRERLLKYGSSGRYGKWFTGKPNLNFTKPLVLLELEELKADPEFREVILLLIMGIIEQELYVANDRSKHTIVVLDEAWDLMEGANTAPFIEVGFRRARKYLGSYLVITQSRLDLEKRPDLGQAISNNSAYTFFLEQKADVVNTMIEKNLIALSDFDIEQLKSLGTMKGLYSEIGVIFPDGHFSIFRLIVPDETKLLYSTDAVEINCINKLKKEFKYTLKDALGVALQVLPYIRNNHMDFNKAYNAYLATHPSTENLDDNISIDA
jgi:conjugal transfer ATP-binding protein TraC